MKAGLFRGQLADLASPAAVSPASAPAGGVTGVLFGNGPTETVRLDDPKAVTLTLPTLDSRDPQQANVRIAIPLSKLDPDLAAKVAGGDPIRSVTLSSPWALGDSRQTVSMQAQVAGQGADAQLVLSSDRASWSGAWDTMKPLVELELASGEARLIRIDNASLTQDVTPANIKSAQGELEKVRTGDDFFRRFETDNGSVALWEDQIAHPPASWVTTHPTSFQD
jgi:hypothetical protein